MKHLKTCPGFMGGSLIRLCPDCDGSGKARIFDVSKTRPQCRACKGKGERECPACKATRSPPKKV